MADRTVRVNIVGDSTQLQAAVNAARQSLQGMANVNLGSLSTSMSTAGAAAGEASEGATSFGDAIKTGLGIIGVETSLNGLVGTFKNFIGVGMEYQGNLNTLAAVTGATTSQMTMLSDKAKALGKDTAIVGASATSAAQAMQELAKGGFTIDEVMTSARGTLVLAAAAQIDGAEAARIQAGALNAFRLEADQAEHVSDVLANAAASAAGEITDMAMGLQQSATVAAGFGISIDDTTTTLALFAKNGIIGSDAGTSFKTMLQQLASPTKAQRSAMEDLNLTVYDAEGNFLGMEAVTDQLSQAHKKLTTEQYNTAASTLFGTDAIRAANILGQEGVEGWKDMSASVSKAGGAAELAAAQNVGLVGAMNRLDNAVNSTAVDLFEQLQPAFSSIVDFGTKIITALGTLGGWFFSLNDSVNVAVLGLAAFILLRGPMLAMWTSMATGAAAAAGGVALWARTWIFSAAGFRGIALGMRLQFQSITLAAQRAGVAMSAMAVRARVAGLTLKAAFLTNPLGWVALAAGVLATLFIPSVDDAAAAVTDFSGAIDENTGKLATEAQNKVADVVKENAADYRVLSGEILGAGTGMGVYTSAILGSIPAQEELNNVLLTSAERAVEASGELRGYNKAHRGNTLTAREYASAVLAGTIELNTNNAALVDVKRVSDGYAGQTRDLARDIQVATTATEEKTAATQRLGGAYSQTRTSAEDVATAIEKANDAMGDKRTLAFRADIDKVKNELNYADLAAQSLTISLLGMTGGTVTADQAARANQAAMRMMATATRQHADAVDSVAKAEQDLEDLRAYGSTSPDEIARAQDAVTEATEAQADAVKELNKVQEENNRNIADAQESLRRAQEDADEKLRKAQEKVGEVQAQAAKDAQELAEAQNAVNAAMGAAGGGADPKAADDLKDAQDRLASAQEAQAKTAKDAQDANDGVAEAQRDNERSLQDARQRVEDAQRSAAEQLEAAQKRIADAGEDAADAQERLNETQEKATPTATELAAAERAVADAKAAVSSAADAQADAVDKAAQSARDMAAAAGAAAGANGDVAAGASAAGAAMEEQRQKFIDAAVAAGYTADEAARMADNQGLIASTTEIAFYETGIDNIILQAQTLNAELDKMAGKHGKWVIINDTLMNTDTLKEANEKAVNFGYKPTDYGYQEALPTGWLQLVSKSGNHPNGIGKISDLLADNERRQRGGRALLDYANDGVTAIPEGYKGPLLAYASGGPVSGQGGPKDDQILARLSNGEFVVRAEQAQKYRFLLELINSGLAGFAEGGVVTTSPEQVGAAASQAAAAAPDPSLNAAASWVAMSAAVTTAWNEQILPVFDALTLRNVQLGTEFDTLRKDWAEPAWLLIQTAIGNAWTVSILPTYTALDAGTQGVGDKWMWLNRDAATPAFDAMGKFITATWAGPVSQAYRDMNAGSDGVGATFTTLAATTAVQWGAIGATISGVYNGQIVPAWTGVQGFVSSTGTFFTGIQGSMTAAQVQITTDLATITTKIDEFFKMVDTRAPVIPTVPASPSVTTTVGGAAGAMSGMADGGLITQGTGPRTDDVHIRASKGEYVVNAKSTAKHKAQLDAINYGGAFADGGMIGEKIGNRVGNAIVDGAQRAVEAGVTRAMDSVMPQYTTVGTDGGPVTLGTTEGARGKFLAAVASQMGLEYVWGGASPPNFDCSGLMSWALIQAGVGKGRLTAANFGDMFPQFMTGEKPGDMALWDTGRVSPKAGHIGAVMDPVAGTMMHTDGAGPSRVSSYRNRGGRFMGFIDPIGGAFVPSAPTVAPNSKPGDPPAAWVDRIVAQIGRGGTGGTAGLLSAAPGVYGQTRLMNTVDPIVDFGPMNMARGTSAMVGALPPGGNVERWRPLYLQALSMLGMPLNAVDKMMYQMYRESSGDPLSYAIDSNYRAGHPSKGLLQTIPGTFRANAAPGYSTNIWDPLSNALASLNYVTRTYGGPLNYPGGAYANGGIVSRGTDSVNAWLTPGEAVISPYSPYKDKQKGLVQQAASWFGGTVDYPGAGSRATPVINVAAPVVYVNNYLDGNQIAARTEVLIDGKLYELGAEINRQNGRVLA